MIVPIVITVISIILAAWYSRPDGPLYPVMGGFEIFLLPLAALLVSGLSWGIWGIWICINAL